MERVGGQKSEREVNRHYEKEILIFPMHIMLHVHGFFDKKIALSTLHFLQSTLPHVVMFFFFFWQVNHQVN